MKQECGLHQNSKAGQRCGEKEDERKFSYVTHSLGLTSQNIKNEINLGKSLCFNF
jgi:hypothetical protein